MKKYRYDRLVRILNKKIHRINLDKGEVRNRKTNKLLGSVDNHGYLTATLTENTKSYRYRIAEMIALKAKLTPLHPMVINHIDGNKLNNSITNLEVVSIKENSIHAHNLGLSKNPIAYGEYASRAKLKLSNIKTIKKMHLQNNSMRAISRYFNVHHTTIRAVLLNKTWQRGNANYGEATCRT